MPIFNKLSDLIKYMEEKIIPESLNMIAQEVKKMVKDYIDENLNDSNSDYVRTGQFLESVSVRVISKKSVEIYFDTSLIRSNETNRYWNEHMSINGDDTWRGVEIPVWMPYFIEWGVTNSLFDRDGIRSMETIKKELEKTKYHLRKIEQYLKSKGINAKAT